jgi:hypothetical protein
VGVGAEMGAGGRLRRSSHTTMRPSPVRLLEPYTVHVQLWATYSVMCVSTARVYMSLLPEHAPAEAEEGFTETEAEKGEADARRAGGEAQTF